MTRTHDLLITNQLLYRLSYTSMGLFTFITSGLIIHFFLPSVKSFPHGFFPFAPRSYTFRIPCARRTAFRAGARHLAEPFGRQNQTYFSVWEVKNATRRFNITAFDKRNYKELYTFSTVFSTPLNPGSPRTFPPFPHNFPQAAKWITIFSPTDIYFT